MATFTVALRPPGKDDTHTAHIEAESMEDAVSKFRRFALMPKNLEMDEEPFSSTGVNYQAKYTLYDVYGNQGEVSFFNKDHVFDFAPAS